MPEEIRAIQCRSCGGAMYSDQKAAAYVCAFCGTSVPWTDEQVFWTSPITFRHKPVQIVDGAMKLGHVEVMTGVDPHDERVLSQKYRQNSIAGKLALWDETTTAAFAGVCRLTFVCPFCGGEFTGKSTQHFFTCSYCSNTFEGEELVRPGGYRREFIMGVRSKLSLCSSRFSRSHHRLMSCPKSKHIVRSRFPSPPAQPDEESQNETMPFISLMITER